MNNVNKQELKNTIHDRNEKIYNKVKKEKWNKLKKDLLKDLGQLPLGFFLLITSMLLGIFTSTIIYIYSELTYINITIIIIFSGVSVIMTLFYFTMSLLCLELYNDSRELHDNEKNNNN